MQLYLGFALVLNAAIFIRTAAGLSCDSSCAACWRDGSPGVDTKFSCDSNGHCGNTCPPGYNSIHCARASRCSYVTTVTLARRVGTLVRASMEKRTITQLCIAISHD
ncbi:hypothetical protein EV426DRAFT_606738, partial [Tirmania nivea]